jgi:hypothetical protein
MAEFESRSGLEKGMLQETEECLGCGFLNNDMEGKRFDFGSVA